MTIPEVRRMEIGGEVYVGFTLLLPRWERDTTGKHIWYYAVSGPKWEHWGGIHRLSHCCAGGYKTVRKAPPRTTGAEEWHLTRHTSAPSTSH